MNRLLSEIHIWLKHERFLRFFIHATFFTFLTFLLTFLFKKRISIDLDFIIMEVAACRTVLRL